MNSIIFGRSGATWADLHPVHRLARLLHTWASVKLSRESWAEYRDEWIPPSQTWRSALRRR